MNNLFKLAQEAAQSVQGISVTSAPLTGIGSTYEVIIEYRGYQRVIAMSYGELFEHSKEWILDNLITQLEKFRAVIDRTLSHGSNS